MTLGRYGRLGSSALAFAAAITFPDGFTLYAEIAAEPEELARGLMFREQLEPGEGMLFIHPSRSCHPIWMRNMLMPIDALWLISDGSIVEMARGAMPCKSDDCPHYGGTKASDFTLELPAGTIRRHDLKIGDRLSW